MSTRVALYCRVSTSDQDCELQLLELRSYVERRGWTIIEEFTDKGFSGAKDRRPALDRMMTDARRRRFDVCLVWRFDRFARSVKHLVLALDEFQSLGIGFISIREALDFTTPIGRAMFVVISAMCALERELTVERVKAGLAKAKSQGKQLGRPRRSTDAQVDEARRLRAAGASWRALSRSLGLPVSTLRDALTECAETPAA